MLEVAVRRPFADGRGQGFTLDAAFTTEPRGVTAIHGPSGAGKTSLILAVAGLLPKATGRIALNGRVLLDSAAGVDVPARRRRVGMVFQDGRLFPHFTVRGNLLYGARRASAAGSGARRAPGDAAADFDHVVEMLGIGHLLARRPIGLSGGERQRVALGRALLSAPDLLLLDEPLAALDSARKAEILPYLERLRDEARMPILYVSHSADEIARLADRVVAMQDGRVTAQGPVDGVFGDQGPAGRDGADAFAILGATVLGHADGLTDLELGDATAGGARLAVPLLDAAPGARVHVRIRARDVMVALDRPGRVSANNVLPATVRRVTERGADALLLLDCAGQSLSAQVTQRAARRLSLAPGLSVYAVVKSVTIPR